MPTQRDREAAARAQRPVKVALALLACIVIGLVAAGAFATYRIYTLGNDRFEKQAAPFFAVTQDLAVEMLNQETAVRGYVASGNPKTLAPYAEGRKYTKLELALIAKDASFSPTIPGHLAAMRLEVASLQAYFAHEIALVRQGPAGQKQAQAQILAGKNHFDHLRSASAALIQDAAYVVKRSHREQRTTLLTWLAVLGLAGLVAFGITVGLFLRVPNRLYRLFREERLARRTAEQSADAARALAHVREAVVLLDDAGHVRYANPAAMTLFDLSVENLDSSVLRQLLGEIDDGTSTPRSVSIRGREAWLTSTRAEFDGGEVVVFRNVSDDRRLEQLRTDFVATAAHELRTPLSAVYGAVRTLQQSEHELTEEMRTQFLGMIETQSERLRVLMDQLLVTAQLDSADLQLHPQAVDVVPLCEELIAAVRVRQPGTIDLSLVSPESSVQLEADPDRLRQVVANLIDNAVKYSPEGGRIEVRVASDGTNGSIEVSDQGLGIPVEEHDHIFEKFYRLDPAMTNGVGGSGLGLHISRELIHQMGGEVTVRSAQGAGSTFTVTLPLHVRAAVAESSLR